MIAAEAEATKNNWPVAIAIIDTTGSLTMLVKRDNTQTASVDIAIGKARTALDFRRPTKALHDAIAAGGAGLRLLSIRGASLIEGGVPIVIDGKVVGAIGCPVLRRSRMHKLQWPGPTRQRPSTQQDRTRGLRVAAVLPFYAPLPFVAQS